MQATASDSIERLKAAATNLNVHTNPRNGITCIESYDTEAFRQVISEVEPDEDWPRPLPGGIKRRQAFVYPS